ncbi:MAG: carboxypeptidase-like regulatory domain-containing protein [Microbacteriaceae bacterium]
MTRRRSRPLAALAAAALVLGLGAGIGVVGGTATPAASASVWTGTLKVQLTTVDGDDWHKKGMYVNVAGMSSSVSVTKRTDSTGLAVVKVKPGKYTITVQSYRTDYTYAISTQDYIKIARGQTKTIGMKVVKGGVISGTVTKPNGNPLPNATVAVTKSDGVIYGYTTTNSKGKYVLRGLQTGRYYVIFNQRSWNDPTDKILQNYAWSYWGGATLSASKKVTVYAQNAYAAQTHRSGVNGRVGTHTTTLTVSLTSGVTSSARLLLDNVTASGTYLAAQSVYSRITDAGGTTLTLKVHAQLRYRIGVKRGSTTYYYTGEGQTLTTDVDSAVYVWISGPTASYTLGEFPA